MMHTSKDHDKSYILRLSNVPTLALTLSLTLIDDQLRDKRDAYRWDYSDHQMA